MAGTLHFHSYLNCSIVPNSHNNVLLLASDYYFVMCSFITLFSAIHFSHDFVLRDMSA